ncbi:MAG: signal peptidase I [Brevundimonas sp.]|nr:MAG: signal peptidase I [Brevundimonas sp.]
MSDEHKPHDDHGPDAGHDAAPESGPVEAPGHDDHAAPEATAHEEVSHEDAPAPVAAEPEDHGHDASDHAEPAAAAHDEHAAPLDAADAAPVTEEPAITAEVHADHDDHAAPVAAAHEPVTTPEDHAVSHDDHPAPADAHEEPTPVEPAVVAAAAAAGVAVAAAQPERRPIWSDAGDAPFEDIDATPVYARGKKGKKVKAKKESGGFFGELWEIAKTIAVALLIAMVLRILLFQPFTIPSASMEPNLYEGDYIVVSKWSYGYSRHAIPFSPEIFDGRISLPLVSNAPKRGDIVVFKLPSNNETDYIKRLIGLPGDRVQMIDNVLHINGQPVRDVVVTAQDLTNISGLPLVQANETFPDGSKTFRVQDFGPGNEYDNTPVFEIPAGYYFMMGDNRDNSSDSRVAPSLGGVGLVPAENLIGKAEIILFSWNEGASFRNPVTWFSHVRLSRWFKVLH